MDLAKTLLEAAGWHCHAPRRALVRALARARAFSYPLARMRACACASLRGGALISKRCHHLFPSFAHAPTGAGGFAGIATQVFFAGACEVCCLAMRALPGGGCFNGDALCGGWCCGWHARFCAAARHSRPPARLSPPPLSCHDGRNDVLLWQKGPCAEQLAEHLLCLIRNVRPCGRTCMAFRTRNP